jgi:hypothetical protein
VSRLAAYGEHSVSVVIFKDQTAHTSTSGDVVSITQAAFTFQIALVPISGWVDPRVLFRSEKNFAPIRVPIPDLLVGRRVP